MAKVIKIRQNYIPVLFEDDNGELKHELRFYKTDDNIERLTKIGPTIEKLQKDIQKNEENGNVTLKQAKKLLKESMNGIFGEGSFEKLYKINPSVFIVVEYYILAIGAVVEELDEIGNTAELEKYLNG